MKKIQKKSKSPTKPTKKSLRLTPLGDRVLLKELKEIKDRTDSGIYIPTSVNEDRGAKRGEVIAVGQGHLEDGKRVPLSLKEGDKVLFQWGEEVVFDGETYQLVRETEIIAIIK